MAALAPQPQLDSTPYSQSIMEDASDTESDPDLDAHLDPEQQDFYQRQQEQAMYYQQHQQQHGSSTEINNQTTTVTAQRRDDEDEEMYSDDDSSTASIPDENINFELTYALHTFVATVEGQASVVKGDSLVLLDDQNSYWWLVRVLKTEDVGYIPAENIETPYERLARLNKHRNVDLAQATIQEKAASTAQGRERLKGMLGARSKQVRNERSGSSEDSASRRVIFAPPTYVDHPGVTWSTDGEDSGEEGDEDYEGDEVEDDIEGREGREGTYDGDEVDRSLDDDRMEMEPDDGIEWADSAAIEGQQRIMDNKPGSNNPFVQRESDQTGQRNVSSGSIPQSNSNSSLNSSSNGHLDPATAGETKRITVTPSVAQGGKGPLLPSAMQSLANDRNASGQSVSSVTSVVSTGSSVYSTQSQGSPQQEEGGKKMKKMKKPSKEELDGGEKRRSKGVLGGLFSRNKDKNKKGISSSDPRASEDSAASGIDASPTSQSRQTDGGNVASAPARTQEQPQVSHSLRLQQRDQALQQAYTNKYLTKSPSGDLRAPSTSEAAAIAHQATNAAKFASMNASGSKRPSSIILSPNPAGPPLLNVIRVFAGDHIKSDSTFKTVLLNETTSANDLIRQLQQRFRLHGASADSGYYLTIKDVSGEELELTSDERPLDAFQEAVQRWAADDEEPDNVLRAMTPTIKRSSISSISSVASLSSHPAIAKLGMNDFSDDSAVKIYLHRRRPGSQQHGMPEPASEFSSYSTQLSAVQENSTGNQSGEWSTADSPQSRANKSDVTASPPTPQPRYNPSLTVSTGGQVSPERYSSPSARFTIQLLIKPQDLPDGSVFDPSSESIVSRQAAREHAASDLFPMDSRKRLFMLPRNATVVEAIEQGLERFGIQDGVVEGGDDIEDRLGSRRNVVKAKYSLIAVINGEERSLAPSSKVLEAYLTPPQLKPIEKMTMEQRRRSRDLSANMGSPSDILPSDPVFMLRRVHQRGLAPSGPLQKQQASIASGSPQIDGRGPLSPQEIIAAQRAASRATQKALISAHANTKQGVDVVVPDRGTFRSSRLMEPEGEVVRYSFIDGDGETYDISEILEEEWGKDGSKAMSSPHLAAPPTLLRQTTDSSNYVTAPSTPEPEAERKLERPRSQDLLQGVLQRVGGQPDDKLEERLHRVINKVKSGSKKPSTPDEEASAIPTGRSTPTAQIRSLSTVPEGRAADITPRASEKSHARQAQESYTQTAATVNRIVSRHRQQPSIASIMSDISASPAPESYRDRSISRNSTTTEDGQETRERGTGSSTPSMTTNTTTNTHTTTTATSSTHPTPSFPSTASVGGSIYTRQLSSAPKPKVPVRYTDDFGIKALMAIVDVKSKMDRPKMKNAVKDVDEVEKMFYGSQIDWEGVHPEMRGIFGGVMDRLDKFDREIDEILAGVLVTKQKEKKGTTAVEE